jgi:hypothetical protein
MHHLESKNLNGFGQILKKKLKRFLSSGIKLENSVCLRCFHHKNFNGCEDK